MSKLDSAEVDHAFFSKVTPLSSYIAGFIAADGCIVNDRVLQVSVNVKDQVHLQKMLKHMKSNANLGYGKDNTAKFSIPSTQIAADLLRHYNITPRKSLTLEPPNITGKDNIKAFISGYIDGDGCFRYGSRSKDGNWKYLVLEVIGTRRFLEWMNNNLPVTGSVRDIDTYARLALTCAKAYAAYNYLWDPSLPLLERKWDNRYKIYTGEKHGS